MKQFHHSKLLQMMLVAVLCIATSIPDVALANVRSTNLSLSKNAAQVNYAPCITLPGNNSIFSLQDVTINWSYMNVPELLLVNVTDQNTGTKIVDNFFLAGAFCSYTISQTLLQKGHSYKVVLTALDSNQKSYNSNEVIFSIEPETSASIRLYNFRNSYTVTENQKVSLSGAIQSDSPVQTVTVTVKNVANGSQSFYPKANNCVLDNTIIDAKALGLKPGTYDIDILANSTSHSQFILLGSAKLVVNNTTNDLLLKEYNQLAIGYHDKDNETSVTQDITLTTVTPTYIYISWKSSNPNVISTTGKVTRQQQDAKVTLTATLSNEFTSMVKTFQVTVKGIEKENLAVTDFVNSYNISKGETLTLKGNISSNTTIQKVIVKIYRQELFSTKLVTTKTFNVNSKNCKLSDIKINTSDKAFTYGWYTMQIFAATSKDPKNEKLIAEGGIALTYNYNKQLEKIKNSLSIKFGKKDNGSSVTTNIYLPTVIWTNASVRWESSNEAVIRSDGTVTRPIVNTTVTLTATITFNGCTTTKSFTVTVKGISLYKEIKLSSKEEYVNQIRMTNLTCSGVQLKIRNKVATTTFEYYSLNNNELKYAVTVSGAALSSLTHLDPGSYRVRVYYYNYKNQILCAGETTITQN